MSINLAQAFVRYPDVRDAAELLRGTFPKDEAGATAVVSATGTPWLSVCGRGNDVAPEAARALSRALEAQAVWYGLAGGSLAYRLLRYEHGREVERLLVPEEIFGAGPPARMPEYRDVEEELYRRLRGLGIPADYVYLFVEEIGVAGGAKGEPDAAAVRPGETAAFRHRVPRRETDRPRTLFDQYREGEQSVTETLRLAGGYDEGRARGLLAVLDGMVRRRALPPGWTVRFAATSPETPDLAARVASLHAKGRHAYEFGAA
jgi:hypothetical protein